MPLRDVLMALVVVAIWGFNFVVIKLSVDAMPPILAAGFRFALAAFPAILFIRPPKVAFGWVAAFGLCFGLGLYSFLNVSLAAGMPAGLASVVLQAQAFFTIAIAFFVLKERPRRQQIIGGAVAFAGIGVIALERSAGASVVPLLLALCGALSWGCANVVSKKAGRVNPVAMTVWGSAIAAIPLFALSLVWEGAGPLVATVTHPSWQIVGLVLFLAYPATLFGLAVWNHLLSHHPASLVAPFTLLVPITGLASGWLVLGETIAPLEIAGGLLVVLGLATTVIRKPGARARGEAVVTSAPPEGQA